MRMLVAALILCSCTGVTVLRYRPSRAPAATSAVDHGRSTLSRPARGEATSTVLADGFPVWVVHHDDGTVSVISGVAPPRAQHGYGRGGVVGQVDRTLVSWIAGVRRFYAGGILFDEHGHALGYADADGCTSTCPQIETMPLVLRDLDTFAVTDALKVGHVVTGQMRLRAATWLPWRRPPPGRDEDMRAAVSPTIPLRSIIDALALADGQYAVVDGKTIRSTHAEPVLCSSNPAGACGTCDGDRLELVGIASSDAAHIHSDGWWRDPGEYRKSKRAVYVESESGTFLVKRQGRGFQIVAGIFRGSCSGSW